MHYENSEMKLDQLIAYFNQKKINLIPPFQRGHVWSLPQRQKLLENMITGRPIPAIFLYKEADGSKFTYNILDGKQRLESLLLFIGSKREDMKIDSLRDFFSGQKERQQASFSISFNGKRQTLKSLPEAVVREFREYAIPTIAIDLDENGSLDEIINLFVDINQQGEKVKRFDIVKAIGAQNDLLNSVLELIASRQTRKSDFFLKKKSTSYTRVLQNLQFVERANDSNQQVDRMWERLVEIVLFSRTRKHRAPGQILRSFIKSRGPEEQEKLKQAETIRLKTIFNFLDKAYKGSNLGETRLGKDVIHFYTMVTTLLSSDLLSASGGAPDYVGVRNKLIAMAKLIDKPQSVAKNVYVKTRLDAYLQASQTQTTHPGQRETRQSNMIEILAKL